MQILVALALIFVWPSAASVLLVSGAVYAVLQTLKAFKPLQPYIGGWVALALNVVLSVLGVVTVLDPAQLYTWGTLQLLLTAIFGAAGIHGTVKSLLLKPTAGAGGQQKLGALMLCAVLLMGTIPVTGCSVSTKQIAADAQAVAAVALQIGTALEPTYSAIAKQVETAANDVMAVAKALGSGTSTVQQLTAVMSALYVIMAAIPQTAAIAQFLPIIVTGIEAVYSAIAALNGNYSAAPLKIAGNPYHGMARIHHRIGRSIDGDFRASWNAAVQAYPGAGLTRI